MGSLKNGLRCLEAKAIKASPDLWEGISNHTQAFRNKIWLAKTLFSTSDLTSRKILVSNLNSIEKETLPLDPSEKDVFFGFENNESRNEFWHEKIRDANRVVELVGNQGEKIAEKSAEVQVSTVRND